MDRTDTTAEQQGDTDSDIPEPMAILEFLAQQFQNPGLDQRTRVMAAGSLVNYYVAKEVATMNDLLLRKLFPESAEVWTPEGAPTGMPAQ